ncbi:MAG: ferredoxin family protein [Deltaproteobacteria bacterium]|nr:ferredoxin family protein [Deltaproteobacteria bacterium]
MTIRPTGLNRKEQVFPSTAAAFAAFAITLSVFVSIKLTVSHKMILADRFVDGLGWAEALALSVYAAWLVRVMSDARQASRWRPRIWMAFSLVFFSQLALGLAGFKDFLMTGKLHLPVPAMILAGPLYRSEGFFMPFLFGATILFVGPAWCSYLCYMGAWDHFAAAAVKRPVRLPRWRRPLQVGMVVVVAGTALALRAAGVGAGAATMLGIGFGLVGVAIMASWSRRTGQMTHCITWCPIGALATWLGRLNPFRIGIGDACDDCMACTVTCRYHALTKEDVARRRPGITCTLCGDCVRSCKDRAIGYRFPGLSPVKARAVFLVLVVSLHATFMGLGMV